MTDPLTEAREAIASNNRYEALRLLPALLDHAEKQAARIEELRSTGMLMADFYIKATNMKHDRFNEMADMALDVIDYAETWQAIAIEERAKGKYYKDNQCGNYVDKWENEFEDIKEDYRVQAARELGLEAGNWRKICPDDKQTLEWILEYLCDDANDAGDPMILIAERLIHNLLGDGIK